MNLFELFKQGIKLEQDKRAVREQQLAGVLRGGNSGYVVNGEIRGRCAREAVMRYFGIDKAFPVSRSIMFGMAEYVEQLLISKFTLALEGTGFNILAQDGCSIEWNCKGIDVKGSPDIVFADGAGTPQLGIECKMASSIWTVRDVSPFSFIPGKPKADHLAQAGHYMRKLGEMHGEDYIPWYFIYVCPVDYHAHTEDLRKSQSTSEFLTRQDYGAKEVFRVDSHMTVYELCYDSSGRLMYRLEGTDKYLPTEITVAGIEQYYELVVDALIAQRLPARMVNTDCTGKKLKWSRYDQKYNDYADLHDQYDAGNLTFNEFIQQAKLI